MLFPRFDISVPRRVARPLLWLLQFIPERWAVLVCLDYQDDEPADATTYTSLVWADDGAAFAANPQWNDLRLWLLLRERPA